VDLVMADFTGHLWDAMRLVAGTDVFVGMHGAGFTHLLWLRQVTLRVLVAAASFTAVSKRVVMRLWLYTELTQARVGVLPKELSGSATADEEAGPNAWLGLKPVTRMRFVWK
jgi:hypothetical protein